MPDAERLAEILGELHEHERSGQSIDLESLVRRYPDLAKELRDHVDALALIDDALEDRQVSEDPLPEQIGDYRIEGELGRGGMGTVYLARGPDEEEVAVKVIHPHLLERRGFFKRFLREAQLGAKLRHENVVRTLDVDAVQLGERTAHFLVMEHVQGKTLRSLLQELGAVPEALLCEIALQAAAGLAAIHEQGIVHRDLKPENLLITDDHRVRIMDLGVARSIDATLALTQEGQFAGSLLYAAPEQFERAEVGPAADLYALGVLLHELATGDNPFRADQVAAVIQAHLELVPARIQEIVPEVSPFFSEVVATLLEKKPSARIPSAGALVGILERGEEATWWAEREREVARARARLPVVPVRRETKLYGREEDLAVVRKALARAREGEGNTILLEGEAGIGKSRLVDSCLRELADEGTQVLYGSYPPAGGMGAISEAFLTRFGVGDLEEKLVTYLRQAPSLAPGLAALVKHEAPPPGSQSLEGDALHAACVHVMRALAAEKHLLWIIEDLHFASREGRHLALSLARAVEGHPVLLVLTSRPGIPEEEFVHFGRLESLQRVRLARLGARDVVLLLKDAFRSERLAEKLGGRIALKSDGVPFFVFEMIRGLKEGQFIEELPDGSWVESKVIEEIEVPSAVKDLIEVRLRDLTSEERAILDVGAVEGFEFEPDLVARVLESKRVRVLQQLAEIERRSGVVCSAGRRYRFDHHQIQEVLYAGLAQALQEEYHSLLARVFADREGATRRGAADLPGQTAVFLADHGLRGHDPVEGRPYLDRALRHLEGSYRWDEAIVLADRALSVSGLLEGGSRLDALLRKNTCLDIQGRRAEQETVLSEARSLADLEGDDAGLARVSRAQGSLFHCLGRNGDACKQFERSLALARRTGDVDAEAAATVNLGATFTLFGRYDEALELFESGRQLAIRSGNRRWEANAIGNLGEVHLRRDGRYEEAKVYAERDLAIRRKIGDRGGEAVANGNLAALLVRLGRGEEALECAERRLRISREIGDRGGEARALRTVASVLWNLGQVEEALAYAGQVLVLTRERGDRSDEAAALGLLGAYASDLGRHEEASVHIVASLALCRETGDRRGEVMAIGNLALVCHRQGRFGPALEYSREYLTSTCGAAGGEGRGIGLLNLGGILLEVGRHEEASEHIEESLAICRKVGYRRAESYALTGLASLAHERHDDLRALEFANEALVIRRETGQSDGVVDALLLLGDLLWATRDRDGALEVTQEAVRLLRERKPGGELARALALLACLRGGGAAEAEAALEEAGEAGNTPQTRYYLWMATGKSEHLAEAKRLLDYRVEHAPEEYRESMLKNVRLHREIMEAWAEHSGGEQEEASDRA